MKTEQHPIKHDLYAKAYGTILKSFIDNPEQDDMESLARKMIVYGVKVVNTKKEPEYITWEEAEHDFQYAESIKTFMGLLTPIEFMELFPISKEFKGHKYGFKDYFYTRDYLKGLDPNEPIGDDKAITKFLWNYCNEDIDEFNANLMTYLSNLRKLTGQTSLMEEFAGIMGFKTYTMHTDQKGKQFLQDKETGKITKVRKARPRYLKLIR